jgi:signal transduction histidine kinase
MPSRLPATMIDPAQAVPTPDSRPVGAFLAFERLLAELSAGFVNLSPSRVDDAITDALRRIVALLDVDRANLIGFAPQTGESNLTHSWTVDGFASAAPRPVSGDFPWAMQRLQAGHPIVFSRLDELPAEAAADATTWRRIGVKANLTVPMTVGGRIEGAIAFASFRRERHWPGELVSRLHILAEVFGNALAHKRARESLDSAMKFERLVSGMLAALLMTDRAEDRDRVIEAGLRDMALSLGAERATLWQRIGTSPKLRKTHRWLAAGVPVPPEQADGVAIPWISAQIVGGTIVRFASRAGLPPEAAADLPALHELGVRSLVMVPVTVSGAVVRALSFATVHEERDWPEALVPRIALLGEVLASVLARDEAQRREREAMAQAAHATRVGAMGAFAASLAHELTQPLAAGLANAETGVRLLAAAEPDLDELRATLADIVADERRAGDLVQKLRRFLRRGEVEHGELAPAEVLEEVLRLVGREAEARGVRLHLEIAGALPKIVGDRVQLQQVVLNLLSNAMDAAAAGTRSAREVAVLAGRSGDGVRVEVRDSGAGMDADTLARIFQPFFTTKPKGMGLGLSISRTIVAAHGGTLSAHTAPGKGSTFRIELPLRPPRDAP